MEAVVFGETGTEMIQNQTLKVWCVFIREIHKAGPLQPMFSQKFAATLVFSDVP